MDRSGKSNSLKHGHSSVNYYDKLFPALPGHSGISNLKNKGNPTKMAEKRKSPSNSNQVTRINTAEMSQMLIVSGERRKYKYTDHDLGRKEIELYAEISKKTGATLDVGKISEDNNALTFFISGVSNSIVNEARRKILSNFPTLANVELYIPINHFCRKSGESIWSAKITKLEKNTGSKISIQVINDIYDEVKITGTREMVDKAVNKIEKEECLYCGGIRLTIDPRVHSRIIGPNEQKLRKIRQMFQVRLEFSPNHDPNPSTVLIYGNEKNVANCKDYLLQLEKSFICMIKSIGEYKFAFKYGYGYKSKSVATPSKPNNIPVFARKLYKKRLEIDDDFYEDILVKAELKEVIENRYNVQIKFLDYTSLFEVAISIIGEDEDDVELCEYCLICWELKYIDFHLGNFHGSYDVDDDTDDDTDMINTGPVKKLNKNVFKRKRKIKKSRKIRNRVPNCTYEM